MIYRILTQNLRERFEATKELDASHMIHGVGRFRVNVFQQRGSVGAVLRAIPHEIPGLRLARAARRRRVLRRAAPWARPRHRPDRLRQVDEPRFARQHHQPHQAVAHHDGRGPDRVPAHAPAGDREPARGRARTPSRSPRRCATCCARTRTSSSSVRCATSRRSRRRSPRPRLVTSSSRRCTPRTPRRRSTASSTSSRPPSRTRFASSWPVRSKRS